MPTDYLDNENFFDTYSVNCTVVANTAITNSIDI